MEINSLNGAGAYANTPNSAPPVDNTRQNQTDDALQNTINPGNTGNGSQAFEVTITREARDRLAAETDTQVPAAPAETQGATMTPEPQDPNDASAREAGRGNSQETNQIVNIVA